MKAYAVHPGPVVHVPPRARVERTSFDRLRTRVEIPEAASSEMPLVGSIREWPRVHLPVALHEGALWTALRDPLQKPLSASGLAALLADGAGGDGVLPENLFLSPFHVPVPGSNVRTGRGAAIEPARVGRIASDHRDAAQAAARAFAASDLRIRDGQAWVRMPGPFLIHDIYAPKACYRLTTRPYADAVVGTTDLFCPHEDMAAFHAHRTGTASSGRTVRDPAIMADHCVNVPLPSSREETLRFAANRGVVCAHRGITDLIRSGEVLEGSIAAVRAAADRLSPYLPLASISAIPASDASGPVLAMNAALADVATLSSRNPWLARQARWSAIAFTPRLEAAVPDEDMDALGGLSARP